VGLPLASGRQLEARAVECDPRPDLAAQEGRSIADRADRGQAARLLDERAGGTHFRPHRTRRELGSRERVRGGAADRASLRRAPAGADGVDVGDDHERVGSEVGREQRAREILVDDRLDPLEPPACGHGLVSDQAANAFDGMSLMRQGGNTVLVGLVSDQPQFHGLLQRAPISA
jgi:hypothetical protein